MSQVDRTSTSNKSLRVADVSEVLNKSLEESTLMNHDNKKIIVRYNLWGPRKLGTFFNNYSRPVLYNDILRQEYFSISIATALYYVICLKVLMLFSCKGFIVLVKFYNKILFLEGASKLKLFSYLSLK